MASGIDWFRWHHGSVTDPKFQLVAKKSGASVAEVVAVWAALLEHGSANGASVADFDFEACDELFGFQRGCSHAIGAKLTERGFIVDGRIANTRRYFPSVSLRPSGGAWAVIRAFVFKRDNYTCNHCGSTDQPHVDHKLPASRGGLPVIENLWVLCRLCNSHKRTSTVEEWLAKGGRATSQQAAA